MTSWSSVLRQIRLPRLHPTAGRVLRLLQAPKVDLAQVVRVAESDLRWAGEVVRLAESPVWELAEVPADLRTALGALGTKRFYQVVLLSAVNALLRIPRPGPDVFAVDLEIHSLAVAVATREILREKGLRPCEDAVTAALLHDVGEALPLPLGAGLDHAEAGALLVEYWGLPSWLADAVRLHQSRTDGSFVIADLVRLADRLCHVAGLGGGVGRPEVRETRELASRWGLSPRSTDRVQGRTVERVEALRKSAAVGEGG